MKPCYLSHTRRGCYVGTIQERWTIDGKVDLPRGSQFVVWPLGTDEKGPKLLEVAPPGSDISKAAILLVKLFHVKGNQYYGTRRVTLRGELQVTTSAEFNLFQNERDFGLTVR